MHMALQLSSERVKMVTFEQVFSGSAHTVPAPFTYISVSGEKSRRRRCSPKE